MDDLTIEVDDETLEKLQALAASKGMDVEDFADLLFRQAAAEVSTDGPSWPESTAGAFAKLREEAGGGLETELLEEPLSTQRLLDRSA